MANLIFTAMSIPTNYSTIKYIESDEGLFENLFSELLEEITIKRVWKEITTDDEGLKTDVLKEKMLTIDAIPANNNRITADLIQKIDKNGNYLKGSKFLLTTAILEYDNEENVNDVVILEGEKYNVVSKRIYNKVIPHAVYGLELQAHQGEIEEED